MASRVLQYLRDNVKTCNVLLMGFAFMVFFTGFLPTQYIQQLVISSVREEDPSFEGDGYTSLAIIYTVFAFASWVTPSLNSVAGPKYTMIIGFSLIILFVASFLKPMTWSLYLTSVFVGFGGSSLWTGQGNFITINSTDENISRNSGVFWAMFECSLLFGNLIIHFKFYGLSTIDGETRFATYSVLLSIACVGVVMLFALRTKTDRQDNPAAPTTDETIKERPLLRNRLREGTKAPIQAFVTSFKLLQTKDMLVLSIAFAFTGFELGFFSGVYGTAVGFTQSFGNRAKELVGLNGILIGIGEICGGGIFGVFGKWVNRVGRDPAFLLGYLVHMIAYYLIFLNLPDDSPLHETPNKAYILSNEGLVLACAFMLGFGDGCFNPQVISLLGSKYSEDSAPAFALYKFIQSLAAAASFFYSPYLLLYQQLLILVISGTAGVLAFCAIEWKLHAAKHKAPLPLVTKPDSTHEVDASDLLQK